jgi:hypothetical protein
MDKRQLSHDILNMIERLKIMHDLIKDGNYEVISKNELTLDLKDTLIELEAKFQIMLQ